MGIKYTIEGFSQEQAVKLGLTAEDLVILRWFVDFWPSPGMLKMNHDGKEYGLVSYSGFIEQMPIVGCNKRTIARKFQRLVDAEVLENITIKQGGSFSVYRFGKNYSPLVQKCTTVDNFQHTVAENSTTGLHNNVQPGLPNNEHTKTLLHNSTNQLRTNQVNMQDGDKPRKRFTPPSVDDIKRYCQESGYSVDPEKFIDYYTSNGWMVGKNHMKDWKATVRNWARKDRSRQKEEGNPFLEMLREEEEKKYGQNGDFEDYVTI